MKTKRLIIYGVGKFADYIAYLFNHDSEYDVEAYCLESNYLNKIKDESFNLPVVALEEIENTYSKDNYDVFVAVGNDKVRERIFNLFKAKNYTLASFISPMALFYSDLEIGQNVFISADCGIQPFVKIKDNSIIIASKIGHHCIIEENTLLSLTIIGANSIVGKNSFLGINSAVMPNIKIGSRNIIGMGCAISKNTKDGEVYTNNTTVKRKVTYDDISEKYL